MANHLAFLRSGRVPAHGQFGDTASPSRPITCPTCRAMLETKAAAHIETSAQSTSAQDRKFFAADAARTLRMLSTSELAA